MLIVLTALAFLFFGWESAWRLSRGRESTPLERATWAMSIALGTWLGSLWVIALLHWLTPTLLIARTICAAIVAIALRARRPFEWRVLREVRVSGVVASVVLVIVAWSAFMLWRGALIPPLSHDALSYHLPKAVFYARAGGFEGIEMLDPRPRDLPANYELLLSEFIVLEANDKLTEWLSLFFDVGFFLGAGALAERWWPRRSEGATAVVCVLSAGVPVVLLHSGAHKNDLMAAFCIVAAFVTAGRWITTRERFALLLSLAMFAMAVGTKPQGAIAALALVPFLGWRWWTTPHRWRELALAVCFAVLAFAFLGGAVYVANALRSEETAPAAQFNSAEMSNVASLPVLYGDWSNLWQAPYVLLAAPFSPHWMALRVPWESEPWFWRRYDLYISHAGIPFVLCALALPFVVMRFQRDDGPAFERMAIVVASLITTMAMLPVVFAPHGFYAISLPRYIAFLYPVVFAWVVPPLFRKYSAPVAAIAILAFLYYAVDNVMSDDFVPPAYLAYAREHPGTRVIPFDPNRAASIVDRAAGPADRIAVEAAFGTWLMPAFGANLTRPIDLIRPGKGAPRIPDAATWVIVDRGYDVTWGHPDLRDLREVKRYGLRGKPSASDQGVLESLLHDGRFEVVFYNPARAQAVFHRLPVQRLR
jgi:hypothetical protein